MTVYAQEVLRVLKCSTKSHFFACFSGLSLGMSMGMWCGRALPDDGC